MATILSINHSEAAQRLIQATLGKQYNIVIAVDGSTAIQYCAMIQLDLILLDLALPDMDGYDLASRLKIFMPRTPILIFSDDYLAQDKAQLFINNDFNELLTKPVQAHELLQRVQSILPPPPKHPEFITSALDNRAIQQFETQIAALNQANKRLASLNAISALIGTSLDLEHLTDEVLAQIHKIIDFDSATLMLLKGDVLEAAASRGFSSYRRGMNIYRRSEQNSAWHVVRKKLPLIIKDVKASESWESRPELEQIRSWMGVPLLYKDRVVGVLTLDKNEPNAFTDADARYIFTLASQIAIAVENAQLFQEWENQSTRLKLINEVAREITTILDVNDLFTALAKAIFERLHYDRVAILEVDKMRLFLGLKAVYGNLSSHPLVDACQQPIEEGLLGEVVRTGKSILVNDVSQERDVLLPEGGQVQSRLIVPIFVDNQVEAVIEVQREGANGFNDHDLWTLNSLASQAATVIENARLYRDLGQRLSDLAVLNDASQTLTSTIALEQMLSIIIDRVRMAMLAENGYVLLVESSDDMLTFAAKSGPGMAALSGVKVGTEIGLINQIILQGEAGLFKHSPDQADLFSELEEIIGKKISTLVVAPLKTWGIIIGLVILINKETGDFDGNDLNLLSALSKLMAGAVENAQLFSQLRAYSDKLERTVMARTQRLQAIKKISQVVSQGLDVDKLLAVVGRDISQIFGPEAAQHEVRVVIGLVDGSNVTLKVIYKGGECNKLADKRREEGPFEIVQKIDPEKPIGQVINLAKPMMLSEFRAQEIYDLGVGSGAEFINSALMAPLITGGKTIGLILVESQLAAAFDESDLETLESLTFQVASAIEHARLLQKTREIAIVEERTRLARDMHDGVAQNLAYLLIQTDRCLNMVEEGSKLERQLEQIGSLLKQNIDELRRNIFDLRPVELEGKSLFKVLENFVTEFGQRWNLKTSCVVEGEAGEVEPEVESSLYRILQEALSNAQQHAQCSELAVKLTVKDNWWVTLEVCDNGQGFEPKQGGQEAQPKRYKGKGLGLVSMRERVERIGGQLLVESQVSQGTRVFARLPLRAGITDEH